MADVVPDVSEDCKLTVPVNREDCKPKKRRSKRHRHRGRADSARANMAAIIARIDAFEAARVKALARLEGDACSYCDGSGIAS
jgi:hypothetical protein